MITDQAGNIPPLDPPSLPCSWQKLRAPLFFVGNNHGVTVELEGLGGGGTIEIEVQSLAFYFPDHQMQRCIL